MKRMADGIVLMTLCIEEIERGSPRWVKRGGQSHGWKVLEAIVQRYQIPRQLANDIIDGFLRARLGND